MKNIGVIFLTYFTFFSYAQTKENKTDNIKDIQNIKTEKHINIPFTHSFLKIPPGYNILKNQTKIIKNDYTGINVLELDGGNFYTNAKQVTKINLEKRGFEVLEFLEFRLNENPAIMYLVVSPDKMNKSYQLVTGDSTFSVILIGLTSPSDSSSLKEIKDMMFSFVYDKNFDINYAEIAPFNYNPKASKFKLANATSNFYTFSIDGIKKKNYEDEPFIIVSTFPNQTLTPKSISLNMKNQIQAQGIDLILKEDSFSKINGYKAYEVLYRGKQQNQELEIYILTMMNEKFTIVVQGRFNNNFERTILEIKKFAHSITIK